MTTVPSDNIQTIDDYFRTYASFHVKKSMDLLDPLHVPGRDELPDFDELLDGCERRPFEPQAHVIAAIAAALDRQKSAILAAEMGCIAGESEVYDPVSGIYRRVDMIEGPFHVISRDAEGKAAIGRAHKPFIKGTRSLWRVKLSNGQSFVATDNHRILTNHGWAFVSEVAAGLGGCVPVLLPSIAEPCLSASLQDAGRSSRTPSGSTDRCSTDRHPCGGRPRSGSDADRGPAPPPGDAPAPGRDDSRTDDRAGTPGHTRPCPPIVLPARSDSSRQPGRTIPAVASEPPLSSGLDGPGGSPFRDDPQSAGASLQPHTSASCPLPDTRTDVPWSCTPGDMGEMVHVTDIVYERTDRYYDFTVDVHHNYVMSGVVHHNTGKTMMGMCAAHYHASRSVRKGGRNGRYRAIVLCPDHLIMKWKQEIEETIPGAKVITFDVEGGGCKQLIRDMAALYAALHGDGRGGRRKTWRKPDGPEWYILGKDQSKLMPGVSALGGRRRGFDGRGMEYGSSRRKILRYRDKDDRPVREEVREYQCPRCGGGIVDKEGRPVSIDGADKMLNCGQKIAIELPPEEGPAPAAPRAIASKYVSAMKAGAIFTDGHNRRYRVSICGEPLWQYVAQPRRWAPARFLAKKMPRLFDYLIADEVHMQKGKTTAQANAFGMLASQSRKTLALTGTLIGGYARDIFYVLLRTGARGLKGEGYGWGGDINFTREYGRIERTVTIRTRADGTSTISKGRKSLAKDEKKEEDVRPAPGVMPALFGRHLIGRTIFLSLEAMASNLPRLREYPGGAPLPDYDEEDRKFWCETAVNMLPEQEEAYREVEEELADKCQELLQHGSPKLLGQLLVATLGYPDMPFGWKAPTGRDDQMACGYWDLPKLRTADNWIGVVQPKDLDREIVYPKEQALLDIVEREVGAGNQVWVYCQMTDTRDVRPRLQKLLKDRGFSAAILRSSGDGGPKPKDRIAWIDKEGSKANVIISHPQLVETGIDFFRRTKAGYTHNFNAIVFYETGYNIFTLRQAARRAWRLGQDRSCRVYYLYYRGTGQQRAMQLIARKMGAALALDGELSAEGLAAMSDDQSAAMALARSIADNIDDSEIGRNWTKVGAVAPRIAAAPDRILMGPDGGPIPGIDILSMGAELLAQTLLDRDPGIDPSQLAALYEQFSADDGWLADIEGFADIDVDALFASC